jgi:hypothetical protein
MSLRDDQVWFAAAVIAGASVDESAHRLTAGPKLTASERLDVYRHGYRGRLVECLADDYPVLKHALGEAAFETLCHQYIARFPSKRPNLNTFGQHMPGFCEGFLSELAALEWAVVQAIHAAEGRSMVGAQLASMRAEAWASVRLRKCPSLQVLRANYPVNDYYQAVREGNDPTLPAQSPSATAVYRAGLTVWRQRLTPVMADVLSALARGETLEQAVAHVPDGHSPEQVLSWFREWVEAGLFEAVDGG